jgi:hypothetical protein
MGSWRNLGAHAVCIREVRVQIPTIPPLVSVPGSSEQSDDVGGDIMSDGAIPPQGPLRAQQSLGLAVKDPGL